MDPKETAEIVRATRSRKLTCKSWQLEAPMRMLMNNLHPDVAEDPHERVVYGGIGRAPRAWGDSDRGVATLPDREYRAGLAKPPRASVSASIA